MEEGLSPDSLKHLEPLDKAGFWGRKAAFLEIPLLQENTLSAGAYFDSSLSYLQEVKDVLLAFYQIVAGWCRLSVV